MQPNEDPNNTANWTGAQFEDGSGMTFNDRVPAFGGMSNGGAAAMSPGGGSPMSQDPMAQKAFQKVQQYEGEARGARESGEQKEGPIRQKLMSVLESPPAAQAHLKEVQAQPKPEDYHKGALEFAGAMAVVGAIFGRGSRGSGNVALNAFGAALKGFQEGNLQAYTEATKEWEQATKATIANNQIELDKYKMIIEDKKLNIDQMSAAINLVSTETQNKIMFDMSMAKNYTGFLTAYDKQQAAQQRLELSLKRSQSLDEKSQAPLKAAADDLVAHPEKGADYTAEQWAKIKGYADSHGISLPDQPSPKGSMPRSMPGMYMQEFKRAHPNATPEDLANAAAAYTSKTREGGAIGQRAGAVGIVVDEAERTIPIVLSLAQQNAGKGLATWNAVENRWKVEKGDKGFAQYAAQLNSLINIYGRVLSGGAGKGTVSDLNHARDLLNPNMPLSAVEGALDAFSTEIEIAQTAPERVRQKMQGGGTAPPAGGNDGWTVKEK